MTEARKQQIDRETWDKMSFYIDIVVFAIIAICIYLLIQHSFHAGKISGLASGTVLSQAWFTIAGIIAFLAICLTWIFFRLFRYRGQIERRYR
jgi:preprotein translocase subunit SecG